MVMSSRFAVAVHIMTLLAIEKKDEPTTSDYLARSASTNPVVIRRILSQLRKAGLVTAQPGAGGGSKLARNPEQITLLVVYEAVEDGELFSLGSREQNPYCVCSLTIGPFWANVFRKAEKAMGDTLALITIAQIAQEVEEHEAQAMQTVHL